MRLYIGGMNLRAAFFMSLVVALLASCALSQPEGSAGDARGESVPCASCRSDKPLLLQWQDTVSYREWSSDSLRLRPGTVIASVPPLRLVAQAPEKCDICHSFSPDGLEFDFANAIDTLLAARFAELEFGILYPGLLVPERDSVLFQQMLDSLASTPFVGEQVLADTSPWQDRSGDVIYNRPVNKLLRTRLARLAARYRVRYLAIPVVLDVKLDPKAGKSGAFRWQSLWMLWDAPQGQLLYLDYLQGTLISTNSTPPDRGWSGPWVERLDALLQRGPRQDEPR